MKLNTPDPVVPLEPPGRRRSASASGSSSTSRTRRGAPPRSTSPADPCTSRSPPTSVDLAPHVGGRAAARGPWATRSACSLDRPRRARDRGRDRHFIVGRLVPLRRPRSSWPRQAREVGPEDEPRLHKRRRRARDRRRDAEAAGLRDPRERADAFATGRDPEHSSIAVNPGAATGDEPRGARGRRRTRALPRGRPRHPARTVLATLVGAVVLISEFFMRTWCGRDRRP